MRRMLAAGAALCLSATGPASAVVLVETSDPGFYNDSIGTVLNLSNGQPDDANQPFPVEDDSDTEFPTQPDISAADEALGNWLTDPLNLNSNWEFLNPVPNSWPLGTEVAVIYQFDTLGATNVQASFGVDNGIFVWLNGVYLFGAREAGGFALGEYNIDIGDLPEGTHFLQLLLEDHGSSNGYAVRITADSFIPGPPPNQDPSDPTAVPLPFSMGLLLGGLTGLGLLRPWR